MQRAIRARSFCLNAFGSKLTVDSTVFYVFRFHFVHLNSSRRYFFFSVFFFFCFVLESVRTNNLFHVCHFESPPPQHAPLVFFILFSYSFVAPFFSFVCCECSAYIDLLSNLWLICSMPKI